MVETRLRGWLAGLTIAFSLFGMEAAHALSPGPRTELFRRADAKGEVTIAARVIGTGPLVVLVPSLGRGASDFDDLAARLADAGFKAAAIDPRGIGQSRGPADGLTLFDYADDVAMAAKALSDKPAVFVGHAFGNRVVRAVAGRHPQQVKSLVLLAAGGQVAMAPEVLKALNGVFDPLSAHDHLAAVKLAFFAPANDPAVWTGGWYGEVARQQQAALARTPPETWSAGGPAPMLIVQAAEDRVAPPANAEALRKAYPDRVKVVVLPDAGHAMLPEQPIAIGQIVLDYLKGR